MYKKCLHLKIIMHGKCFIFHLYITYMYVALSEHMEELRSKDLWNLETT